MKVSPISNSLSTQRNYSKTTIKYASVQNFGSKTYPCPSTAECLLNLGYKVIGETNPKKYIETAKLFEKNGFKKSKVSFLHKVLSNQERQSLKARYGEKSEFIEKFYDTVSISQQDAFQNFLKLGNNKKLAQTNFDDLFITHSLLSYNKSITRNQIDIFKQNPQYMQLLENLIKNPVKDAKTFDVLNAYKNRIDPLSCNRYLSYQDIKFLDFDSINYGLRHKGLHTLLYKSDAARLSNFIDTQVIEQPLTLYRGEGIEILNNVKLKTKSGNDISLAEFMKKAEKNKALAEKLSKYVKNNQIKTSQKGFMSTSLEKDVAMNYTKSKDNRILWELTTAPKTKGAYMDVIHTNATRGEAEVLLQKGADITLKDIKFENGIWHIKADVHS